MFLHIGIKCIIVGFQTHSQICLSAIYRLSSVTGKDQLSVLFMKDKRRSKAPACIDCHVVKHVSVNPSAIFSNDLTPNNI